MKEDNEKRVLKIFYDNPEKSFTIREISKLSKIPRATAHKIVVNLKQQKLIDKENRAGNNLSFKIKKINYFVEEIVSSGLIDELIEKLNPSAIVLFGGVRKGESDKDSDIDLFVESPVKKEIALNVFEKKLGRKIDLFVYSDISKVNPDLRTNIFNGIKLYGYLNIK